MKLLIVTGHKVSNALPAHDKAPVHFGKKSAKVKGA